MSTSDKIGLYGKGASDAAKARADLEKATEHAEKNFSKTKSFKCTIQPQPKP
ncbi:MAG TPA: hypothetical protein VN794_11055 [Methylomirabilota bacterium]|nr:hypothetical protein [Methylomirabilota bacterium]